MPTDDGVIRLLEQLTKYHYLEPKSCSLWVARDFYLPSDVEAMLTRWLQQQELQVEELEESERFWHKAATDTQVKLTESEEVVKRGTGRWIALEHTNRELQAQLTALQPQEAPTCEFCEKPDGDDTSVLEICNNCWNRANEGTGWMERALKAEAQFRQQEAERWRPISTAPQNEEVFFWVVARTAEESYTDTSGNPIVVAHAGYLHRGTLRSWSACAKATHWMPLPEAPKVPVPASPTTPREPRKP